MNSNNNNPMQLAWALVTMERKRQVEEEGYDAAHNDKHTQGEMVSAAICYLSCNTNFPVPEPVGQRFAAVYWPWQPDAFKPATTRLHDLAKAAALILAEMERRIRAGEGGERVPVPTPPPVVPTAHAEALPGESKRQVVKVYEPEATR